MYRSSFTPKTIICWQARVESRAYYNAIQICELEPIWSCLPVAALRCVILKGYRVYSMDRACFVTFSHDVPSPSMLIADALVLLLWLHHAVFRTGHTHCSFKSSCDPCLLCAAGFSARSNTINEFLLLQSKRAYMKGLCKNVYQC